MRVDVLCFGVLKDVFGREREPVELPDGASVGVLVADLRGRGVADAKVWGTIAVAVNREYAGLETLLKDGDEVALLPPVSGGCLSEPMSQKRDMGHPEGWGVGNAG